ncbi:NUDIX hydrolase [Rhizobium ruizarguesonis]|uniref:NUDIX hydrolase n=1 Tax=Rhizobium ruizarguesonis TaxID=2081791 RepID=UPI00102FEDFE|nr:NUDIX hydrolase [Rhizobium ruizarguesonis]TBC66958.1 NUDIX hydrolase [Rhizobium ruizarguesonis]TBC68068.1 NUDIX hydrolase [Rhizobium ruizarguesonis]TBC79501.1 NUDIX hydrolase [Rhizobium ruizarguesonis]
MFDDLQFSVFADQIECDLSGEFFLRQDIEERRKSDWDVIRNKRPSVFDGALLRMVSHRLGDRRLHISASRTSFSAYVMTRPPDFLQKYGDVERANPLGLTAIVRTADDQIIVTVRSLTADQNPGALYLIGGYAEPAERDGPIDLFDEAKREVEEEIAVTDIDRSRSLAIGLAYDPMYCHPEMFLLMPSKSAAASIIANAGNAPDRNEASELLACPTNQFLDDAGPLASTPKTWSFIKARQFLQAHLRHVEGTE